MSATITIAELQAFSAVVETGSFTAAAEFLDTNKAQVSRVISRLEKHLSSQLLLRSTRSVAVTEIGRELYERARGILTALEETEASVARAHGEPSGLLRISVGAEFRMFKVNDWIATYIKRYPKVHINADYSNRLVDVIHEGIDVSIRAGSLSDSELSARKLGEIHYGLYASPGYLNAHSPPNTPHQLHDHDLVMFSPRGKPVWPLVNGRDSVTVTAKARVIVNRHLAALDLACDGVGVVLLPTFLADSSVREHRLKPILRDWARIPVPVHAVFASSRYMAPKVRQFIDLAVENFEG